MRLVVHFINFIVRLAKKSTLTTYLFILVMVVEELKKILFQERIIIAS